MSIFILYIHDYVIIGDVILSDKIKSNTHLKPPFAGLYLF